MNEIRLSTAETEQLLGYLDDAANGLSEYGGSLESLRELDWFKEMIFARLNGEPDPPPISEEELAKLQHGDILKNGTMWAWQGGFDGAYVDTGRTPTLIESMVSRFSRETPFLDLLGRGGAPAGTKLEWGFANSITIGDYTEEDRPLSE